MPSSLLTSPKPTNEITYYLTITFVPSSALACKDEVISWLVMHGIDSFMEGSVEHCDIPDESGIDKTELFDQLGGNESPLVLCGYNPEWLRSIAAQLTARFAPQLSWKLTSMPTTEWQEGWKEGFRPITTARFFLYPPWETSPCPAGKMPLVINPGMAFGTGQHATTQLCLSALESITKNRAAAGFARLLDVGTGSGILAIAAKKLGFAEIDACDIDPDAILACAENCRLNQVSGINPWQGSLVPRLNGKEQCYEVIIANILFPVLEELAPALARLLAPGGTLLLSGILCEQEEQMLGICAQHGLTVQEKFNLEDWSCLLVSKS